MSRSQCSTHRNVDIKLENLPIEILKQIFRVCDAPSLSNFIIAIIDSENNTNTALLKVAAYEVYLTPSHPRTRLFTTPEPFAQLERLDHSELVP